MGYLRERSAGAESGSAAGDQALSVDAVVGALRPQVGSDRQVAAGAIRAAGLGQRPSEAEVGVVVDRVALDDGLELLRGLLVPAAAEVGPPQRLADRALLGVEPGGLAQRNGCLEE